MRLILICFLLSSCSATTSATNQDVTSQPEPGYKWYVRECNRCHSYYPPNSYSAQEWQAILKRKKAKVSLTSKQFAELEQYLVINGKQP